MCDDVDLYEDLPILNFGESVTKIDEERQYFKEKLGEKEKDLQNVKEQLLVLQKDKKVLEQNISSLYKTAVNEIQRKDKIIEDLRREKDSIIFRRKGRQSYNVNVTPYTQKSEERILHGANTSEESQNNISTIFSSSDKLIESNEHLLKTPENFSCEKKPFSHRKRNSGIKDVLNNNSDKDFEQIVDIPVDSSSSCSSHLTSNRSKSPDPSCGKKSNYERERRSLSSENQSERKLRQSDNSYAHWTRHISPHSKHRSSRSYHEKSRRDDQHSYHGENRNYYRDEYKDSSRKDQHYKVHSNNEFGGKYYSHSRRNSTPKLSNMYVLSPNKRYTESRYVSSRMGRSTFKQSDNVRAATQLKSKYSKTFRERSVSCTPVKRKGFVHKQYSPNSISLKSPTVLRNVIPVLNLEEKIKGKHFDNEHSEGSGNIIKPLQKCDVKNMSPSDCPLSLNQGCDNCKKPKISVLSLSEQYGEETDILNSASSLKHSNEAQCKELSDVKSGSKRKYNKVNLNKSSSQQFRSNEAKKGEGKSSQSECVLCKMKGCVKCKIDNISNSSTNKQCVQEKEVAICESSSKQSFPLAKEVQLPSQEKSCVGIFTPRNSTTPPGKNFITLNISPSFEDPAVVEENKFSHSIFNEQCEFKRHKRKRFKKLLVTETKNEESVGTKEKKCSELHNGQGSENSSEQQKSHSNREDKSDPVKDCASNKNMNTLNIESTMTKGLTEANNNSSLKGINTTEVSTVDKCGEVGVNPQRTEALPKAEVPDKLHTTMNISHEAPHDKLLRHKTPTKKRKLDSICEELKANLEKKNVAEGVVVVPACSNDNQLNTTAVVVKNTTPNRIVLPKRRRRVPNLQDNVVQVLTQIKSTTP